VVLRRLILGSVLLVYASYWFVIEPPQAHAFYVLAPIALVFAGFWWTFLDSPRARQVAAGVLALNIVFHAGLAWTAAVRAVALQEPCAGGRGHSTERAADVRAPARLRRRRRTVDA